MSLDPTVWGPHYWFFLHTVSLTYPEKPNETVRKKYYDFIQNLPLFIPIDNIGNYFSELLDKYPVTPYLDSRDSFIKWMYFIHNEVNKKLGKNEITLSEALEDYYKNYENINYGHREKKNENYIFFGIILILTILSINFYRKS